MKTHLLSLILVAIVVLSGCTQKNAPAEVEKEYVCADGKTVVKSIALCPPVQVVEKEDPEMKICEDMPVIKDTSYSDYCYMGLAYKRENATICRKLGEYKRAECYYSLAILKENVTICDSAGTQKSYCYSNYAREKGDITTCDKITDINYKDSCYMDYASTFGEISVCEMIKMAGNRDNCYMNIASRQCDSSVCDRIANTNSKEQCITNMQYCGGGYKQPIPVEKPR